MTKQKLHYACDEIYWIIKGIEGTMSNLIDNRPVIAYIRLEEIKEKLNKKLTFLRELALKTEGNYGEHTK